MGKEYDRRVSLLARSLFSICLLMLASGLLVLPVVLLYKSDAPVFWRWSVRWLAVMGAYILVLAGLAFLCWRLLAGDEAALQVVIGRLLRSPYDHFFWVIALAGSAPVVGYLLYVLGSGLGGAIRALGGLGLFWFLLLWVLMAGLYWPLLRRAGRVVQPWLAGVGVSVAALLLVEGCLRVYDRVFEDVGSVVEASADARILGEGDAPWREAYWEEFRASSQVQWTPYLYWRRRPFEGEFINVDGRGVRRSLAPAGAVDVKVFFFGGSTAWGTGARDEHTIPSELVRLLADQGIGAEVTNFGESSYITRQDALLFQLQLQQGNVPDVAVFYWGYNDTYLAWQPGYIGVPANEANRVAEFQFGRRAQWRLPARAALVSLLYDTALGSRLLPALGVPDVQLDRSTIDTSDLGSLEDANLGLTTYPGRGAEDFVEYLVGMMTSVEQVAEPYNIRVLFVWQPVPFMKEPLCRYEVESLEAFLEERPGLQALYEAVDDGLRSRAQGKGNLILLSDLFAGHSECVFIDYVHITEAGDRAVAEKIAPYLAQYRP